LPRTNARTALEEAQGVAALVHGFAHRNHAPAGEKKAEFGAHRRLDAMRDEALAGLNLLRRRLGASLLPCSCRHGTGSRPTCRPVWPAQASAACLPSARAGPPPRRGWCT
jgi:hypothetical protein